MPIQPTLTFEQVDVLLAGYKEYIPRIMHNAISNALVDAKETNDEVMIPAICWMLLQTRLGIKPISEIIAIFNEKAEATQSPHYAKYQSIMNAIMHVENDVQAIG